jgi:hypothetical protein
LAILEPWTRGSVAWFACTAWDEVAKNASLRPGRSAVTWENAGPHSA